LEHTGAKRAGQMKNVVGLWGSCYRSIRAGFGEIFCVFRTRDFWRRKAANGCSV